MVLAITTRASAGFNAGQTASVTSASFTPAANAMLFDWSWAQSDTANFTLAVSGGSLTWTQKAIAPGYIGSNRGFYYLWEADTSGSPSSMTGKVDATPQAYITQALFDVTGNSPGIKPGQLVTGSTSDGTGTVTTGTLPAPATSGNLTILVVGANRDSGTTIVTPAGFSVLAAPTAMFELPAVFYSTTFTGTSVSFSNAPDNEAAGTVLFEIQEGGAVVVSDYAAPWLLRPPGRLSPASRGWNPALGITDAAPAPVAATATASLTLSASGTAAATSSGTGSLSLSGSGSAAAPTSGTASLTLGGSGAASAPTSGTGSLSLSGSGTAQTTATGTGSLTLSATGTTTSPAAGTGSLTLSATGTAVGQGAASGTGALTLSASATAQATATGTGSVTLSATGTASGGGAASGSGSITLAATGSTTSPTSGTAALSLSATGTARAPVTGTASLALSATGAATASPSGTGSLTLVGTGTGRAVIVSTASLSLSAAGAISATAGGTASIVLSGSGAAVNPDAAVYNIWAAVDPPQYRTRVDQPELRVARDQPQYRTKADPPDLGVVRDRPQYVPRP